MEQVPWMVTDDVSDVVTGAGVFAWEGVGTNFREHFPIIIRKKYQMKKIIIPNR